MHSHHSHSGDYVAHGVDPLEDVTSKAIEKKFHTYCLTEHMPRINAKFLYPEEQEGSIQQDAAVQRLQENFLNFLRHAKAIQDRPNASNTKFIVGTEIEGCDEEHISYGKQLMAQHNDVVKFCVGSVHHIRDIPIDFDQQCWNQALMACNNNLQTMLLSYFNLQYKMLTVLKPLVVGHFDIYKLYLPPTLRINPKTGDVSDESTAVPVSQVQPIHFWDSVHKAVVRNLQFIESYGGLIEINTSALRKKLAEPYPGRDICELVKTYCGGRFVLSDDAHAVTQVGVCYEQALKYITETLQLTQMYYLELNAQGDLSSKTLPIEQFKSNAFWGSNHL
ncbi:hypothetical protein ZYGR_0Z00260 [Zygosaccharomyces rouxii]|uniref:Histidinol-phosphatase n=2 Tax=Zygosaccharomyces rouxii TaxID=4956 RepID=C5E1R2_ZYGRC|nr:uncharacterized protein ZYRO0G00682g [Zygosaccharomyces rouxii]KAH9202103.1 Polymerase/histidinol phosphatase-like protein [Zygosaccharomyces rouxii]GAV50603.1 hypothetical protein ZYGR_0Z00260 [Zygosaccharomyces rouxii]CAR29105.1 ZYRO0G00682p [Zygosaccharomyces rouxii]